MGTVDGFLDGLAPDTRAAFGRVVELTLAEEPSAEQGTSYGLPTLTYRGKPLLGFAETKNHLSLFPFSPDAVDQVRDRLADHSLSKGTIRFSNDHPLPDDVVIDVVRLRRIEIDAQLSM